MSLTARVRPHERTRSCLLGANSFRVQRPPQLNAGEEICPQQHRPALLWLKCPRNLFLKEGIQVPALLSSPSSRGLSVGEAHVNGQLLGDGDSLKATISQASTGQSKSEEKGEEKQIQIQVHMTSSETCLGHVSLSRRGNPEFPLLWSTPPTSSSRNAGSGKNPVLSTKCVANPLARNASRLLNPSPHH